MLCKSCGQEAHDNEKFCRECGAPLGATGSEDAKPDDDVTTQKAPVAKEEPKDSSQDQAAAAATTPAAAAAAIPAAVAATTIPEAAATTQPVAAQAEVQNAAPTEQPSAAVASSQATGAAAASQASTQGSPQAQAYGTQPGQQQAYGAQANQQAYGTQANQQAYGAQPNQQAYGAQPGQQAYGAQPNQQAYGTQPPMQQQVENKNKKTIKIIIIVVAAVLVLCCICFFVLGSCVSSVLADTDYKETTITIPDSNKNKSDSKVPSNAQEKERGVFALTTYESTASYWIQHYGKNVYYANPSYIAGKDAAIPDATKIPVDTQQFSICEGYIYYTQLPEGSGDMSGALYRVKLDGTGQVKLADDCSLWDSFYIVDDELYYNSNDGLKEKVFCIDLDDTEEKPELINQMERVVAANYNSIFYTKPGINGAFICDNDLKNEMQLTKNPSARYFIDDENQLFEYISQSNVFYGYSETGQQVSKIAPAVSGNYYYTDGTNLYLCDNGTVYLFNLGTGESINSHTVTDTGFRIIYSDLSDIYYVVSDAGSTTANGEKVNVYLYYQPISGGQATQLSSWFSS